MFIRRKSIVTNSNKKLKTIKSFKNVSMHSSNKDFSHQDLKLSQVPLLQYIVAAAFVGLTAYLLYSAAGGRDGISTFSQNQWWQYIIALIPMTFAFLIIILSPYETVIISRSDNQILLQKKHSICITTQQIYKPLNEVNGLSIVKKGTQKLMFTNSLYYIVINFKTLDKYEVLGSFSSQTILEYFQKIKVFFNEAEVTQNQLIFQDLVTK